MRKLLLGLSLLGVAAYVSGCAYAAGGTDLSNVEDASGLVNITTGDGTFENYTTTGHYTGSEFGIGIGLPFICELVEIWPANSNEGLLTDVAKTAKEDGAESMINVHPNRHLFTGIPFFLLGLYIDGVDGTGIKHK